MRQCLRWAGLGLIAWGAALGWSCTGHSEMPGSPAQAIHASAMPESGDVSGFALRDEGFAAWLPGTPQRSTETIDTMVGPQRIVRYRLEHDGLFIDVGYLCRTDHPLARLAGIRRILAAAMEGTLRKYDGEATSARDISLDGTPGREVHGEFRGLAPGEGRIRLIIAPKHIYHVIVIQQQGELSDEAINVLESLRLSGR